MFEITLADASVLSSNESTCHLFAFSRTTLLMLTLVSVEITIEFFLTSNILLIPYKIKQTNSTFIAEFKNESRLSFENLTVRVLFFYPTINRKKLSNT